jgi:hypothetical protein
MFCKICQKNKRISCFAAYNGRGIRKTRTKSRICLECKRINTNKKDRERNLLARYGTLNVSKIRKIKLIKIYGTDNLDDIRKIKNKRRREIYHAYYASQQMNNVRKWIYKNRDKHNQYVRNWAARNPDKIKIYSRRSQKRKSVRYKTLYKNL